MPMIHSGVVSIWCSVSLCAVRIWGRSWSDYTRAHHSNKHAIFIAQKSSLKACVLCDRTQKSVRPTTTPATTTHTEQRRAHTNARAYITRAYILCARARSLAYIYINSCINIYINSIHYGCFIHKNLRIVLHLPTWSARVASFDSVRIGSLLPRCER